MSGSALLSRLARGKRWLVDDRCFVNCILGVFEKLLSDICEARAHILGFWHLFFRMYYSHFIPCIGGSLLLHSIL